MKILETKNLVKRFNGIYAVDRLSIGIEKGSITGIIGPIPIIINKRVFGSAAAVPTVTAPGRRYG